MLQRLVDKLDRECNAIFSLVYRGFVIIQLFLLSSSLSSILPIHLPGSVAELGSLICWLGNVKDHP